MPAAGSKDTEAGSGGNAAAASAGGGTKLRRRSWAAIWGRGWTVFHLPSTPWVTWTPFDRICAVRIGRSRGLTWSYAISGRAHGTRMASGGARRRLRCSRTPPVPAPLPWADAGRGIVLRPCMLILCSSVIHELCRGRRHAAASGATIDTRGSSRGSALFTWRRTASARPLPAPLTNPVAVATGSAMGIVVHQSLRADYRAPECF